MSGRLTSTRGKRYAGPGALTTRSPSTRARAGSVAQTPRDTGGVTSLDPAIAARLKRSAEGLVPAIVQQHDTGEVLMLGWMDDEALARTIATGRATYWSRSRQEYWVKGETSGHHQHVKEVRLDCDGDTLLVKVDQVDGACHTGDRTCFDADEVWSGALSRDARSRRCSGSASPPASSLPLPAAGPGSTTTIRPLGPRGIRCWATRPWARCRSRQPSPWWSWPAGASSW